jgi:hypothetical protein
VIIQLVDNRRRRTEFQRGVINMGSRDFDDLEKYGDKLQIVFDDFANLSINLIHGMLLWGDGTEKVKHKPLLTSTSALRVQRLPPL